MFRKVTKEDLDLIEQYIGDDYDKCLYLYLDFLKYGLDNRNLKFWFDFENDEIYCVVLKYYSGMHVFSKNYNCHYEDIIELIIKENPSVICAEKVLIKTLNGLLNDSKYVAEYGWVRVLSKYNECDSSLVNEAKEIDFEEITKLIISDHMGEFYEFDDLFSQIRERYEDNYGRNYIIKQDGRIICNASTTAEINQIAVLSNVFTDVKHRGKGLASQVCCKLCNDLIEEGKKVYLINYTDESTRLYDKLGFEISCEIGKLYLSK